MARLRFVFALGFALSGLTAVGMAATPARSGLALADRSVLQVELDACAQRARQDVGLLLQRHDATTDVAVRRLLQQHIEAVKSEARLEALRLQLAHAEATGRTADASAVRSEIDRRTLRSRPRPSPLPAMSAPTAPAPVGTVGRGRKVGSR